MPRIGSRIPRYPKEFLGHRFHPHVGMKGDLLGRLGRVTDHVGPEDELHGAHDLANQKRLQIESSTKLGKRMWKM